jgi:hypothetical protein
MGWLSRVLGGSPPPRPEVAAARACFTRDELEELRTHFAAAQLRAAGGVGSTVHEEAWEDNEADCLFNPAERAAWQRHGAPGIARALRSQPSARSLCQQGAAPGLPAYTV